MNTLVVGGTSGLGLEIAKQFSADGHATIVTGRHDPEVDALEYRELDLVWSDLQRRIGSLVLKLPEIDILVYAAGFFQEGRIDELTGDEIEAMIDVGGRGLIYFMGELLEKQRELDELVTITSTSQWTPRQYEPVYNFVKAGAAHFSNAMAEDGRVGKTLVAGPAGMKTKFWEGIDRDPSGDLDPKWVAQQIQAARQDDYKYKEIRILRQPPRVEIESKR